LADGFFLIREKAFNRRVRRVGRGEKILTAKIAKKIREGREEIQRPRGIWKKAASNEITIERNHIS
jgi:hypothetical protein